VLNVMGKYSKGNKKLFCLGSVLQRGDALKGEEEGNASAKGDQKTLSSMARQA